MLTWLIQNNNVTPFNIHPPFKFLIVMFRLATHRHRWLSASLRRRRATSFGRRVLEAVSTTTPVSMFASYFILLTLHPLEFNLHGTRKAVSIGATSVLSALFIAEFHTRVKTFPIDINITLWIVNKINIST